MKKELRVPPNNLEAEKALLGSVMMRPDAIYEVMDVVNSETFYAERHRLIWEIFAELISKGSPIDLLSVTARLEEKNILERAGGATYLGELVEAVPTSTNAKHYAEIVHKKHVMRNLIAAADHIAELGRDEEMDLEHVLDNAEKRVYEVSNLTGGNHRFIELKETLHSAWDRIENLHKNKDEVRGVPTGFRDLDAKLSGLQKSDLIILAARPSMGKTSLALDIARQAAMIHKLPVGIFSLEMSSHQLIDRMLAAESRVDAWRLRTGKLSTDDEFARLRESLDALSEAPIYIDDHAGSNIMRMRSICRRLKTEKGGLGLIIVDYLQLMSPTTSRNSDNMVQQVTEISRSLKALAKELDVPVLALSQLSRAVEARGGRPRLSDLRDSGSIEQDADVVMFIHREDKYKEDSDRPNIAEILIEKHRNGPTGKVELYFDDKHSSFLNLEKSDFGGFEAVGKDAGPGAAF